MLALKIEVRAHRLGSAVALGDPQFVEFWVGDSSLPETRIPCPVSRREFAIGGLFNKQ